MRRIILMLVLSGFAAGVSFAQDYNTGIGLRLGNSTGLTVKHFVGGRTAVEGLLTTRWHGFDLTGLYEFHSRAFDEDNLKWVYGFGAHLGFFNANYHTNWGDPGVTYNVIGADGIGGIEYTFADAPVNLGIDIKPVLNLIGYTGLWIEFGFSARYVF